MLLMLDGDDLVDPTYFECLYFGLYFNPDKDWSYTFSVGFGNQEYLWKFPFDAKKLITYNFLNYSCLIRKEALLEVGEYDDSSKHFYEDWHLWIRLLKSGHYPVRESFYGFWYRRTDSGELAKVRDNRSIDKKARKKIKETANGLRPELVQIKDYGTVPGMGNFNSPSPIELDLEWPKDSRQHILMIFPWMEIGGADAFNLEFIRLLDKDKYSISIVLTKVCENPWRQKFAEYVDEIYALPSFLDIENHISFIKYLIKTRNTQIVFLSQSYMGYSLLPWLRYNYPEMCIVDYMHIEEKYWRNGGYARTTAAMDAFLDKTCTCNEVTRDVLINDYGKDASKVETVYIGVDSDAFVPNNDKKAIRAKLNLPAEKRIVLFPCRMTPQKRPMLMLEIAKAICKKNNDIIFAAVGNGQLFDDMKEKISHYGLRDRVLMLGEQENMVDYYNACDLTLICSIKEGLTLTAYESLACGTPVLSADVGGQKELIDDKVGCIVPVYQSESEGFNSEEYPEEEIKQYVDAILYLLSDDAKLTEMGKNGRKRIENGFSTNNMVNHIERIFDSILEEKHKNNKTDITNNQFEALIGEYNLLYGEYAKFEENSVGASTVLKIMGSRKYALAMKIIGKLKIKGFVKHFLFKE